MLNITPVPALRDNYIWTLHDDQTAVVVDPGEVAPVQDFLIRHGLTLAAILCTHRHYDHIGGIAGLRELYNVPVYGQPHADNPHITEAVGEGAQFSLLQHEFKVLAVPGHLDDHVAYVLDGRHVFCGDVLFGAGCGRNFEGSVAALHTSLQRLAALPDDTLLYPAHEYTLLNLPFAARCEPDNAAIRARIADAQQCARDDRPTLPSTLALEKATNPFLRCEVPQVIATLRRERGLLADDALSVFTALRAWRDVG